MVTLGRRILMGVDPSFKKLMDDKKKITGLSARELTKELADELTGKRLFTINKEKKKNEIRFNL